MIRRKLVCPPKSSSPVGPKFYRPVFDSLLYALPADALNLCFLCYLDCLISVILDNWLTTGYVQGMSDLLSVVYAILQDDSDAFWCFCGFMDRMVLFPPLDPSSCPFSLPNLPSFPPSPSLLPHFPL